MKSVLSFRTSWVVVNHRFKKVLLNPQPHLRISLFNDLYSLDRERYWIYGWNIVHIFRFFCQNSRLPHIDVFLSEWLSSEA